MNNLIINNFQLLIQQYNDEKPSNYSFKIRTCNKLIQYINKLDFELESSKQLNDIKGIGKKTLDKIDEIINSDTKLLKEIKKTNDSNDTIEKKIKNNQEIQKLKSITGIGPAKAKLLIEKNITLEILLEAYKNKNNNILSLITHHQLLGLKYYEDLKYKIPRNIIKNFDYKLKKIFSNYNYKICGSYRRDKNESGDIDLLFSFHNNFDLESIVNTLTEQGIIVDSLTEKGETKFMGFAKLDDYKYAIRIDIRIVPTISFPFAILYFTGSKKTNTIMRNIAIKMNLKLSEYGLEDKNGKYIEGLKSEQDIFEYLKLDYINPKDR